MSSRSHLHACFKLTTLLLMAVWFPASSHAWLEFVGIVHATEHDDRAVCAHHGDDGHHHAAAHDAADGHYRQHRGSLSVKAPAVSVMPLMALYDFCARIVSNDETSLARTPHFGAAPPELATTWQFSRRMALPSRAPSSVV